MNYFKIYEDMLERTKSAVQAAQAVAEAFDAEEERNKADEDAKAMLIDVEII